MSDLSALLVELRRIVGNDSVLADPAELLAYECDGFPIAKASPAAVVFPRDTQQTSDVVRAIHAHGSILIPRGSGTGLTGGCVGYGNGVIICTSRMTDILEIDIDGRTACVQSGVLNATLTDRVQQTPGGEHLHFAPDPSSVRASTIGGNAATNAGGLHTLKYGVTVNHVLGLEIVLPDGEVLTTRPGLTDSIGPDLPALLCGSEGTLGIITKIWVRLTAQPRNFRTIVAIFDSSRDATQVVADVIASGITPAALEMLDGAMVQVVEQAFACGLPPDAQALLLIEIDGIESVLDDQMNRITDVCCAHHATRVDCSADPVQREQLWSIRKRTFGAIGRISPSYTTQDACVPRSMLPQVIERIMQIGKQFDMRITNVFHAGDGNVHPIMLFDDDDPHQVQRTLQVSHAILEYCISIGGTLTGEHGVGVEKLPMMKIMFDTSTLDTFNLIKHAFDPDDRANLGKLLPTDKLVVDLTQPIPPRTPGGALAV